MKQAILDKLTQIEKDENVTILYAAEAGSRAWGFASTDSDYDCRFFYARPYKEYLRTLKPERDVIELPIEGDLDINGWDIFKALNLLAKSNPPLIEWLFSPIVYRENGPVAQSMRNYIAKHYSSKATGYHYFHMAEGNYKDYIKDKEEVLRKKYLYVLRPLVCIEYMKLHDKLPPVKFTDVLDGIMVKDKVKSAIKKLNEEKMSGKELGKGPHDIILDEYISQAIESLREWVSEAKVSQADFKELDRILHEEIFKIS